VDLVWRFADGGVCDGVIISFLFYFLISIFISEGGGGLG